MEIARLSLCDYADDLVALVESLDRPPLLVGYSLGGLVVQLVASRARHIGMIAACPSAVGPAGLNRTTLGISVGHALKPRPWAKPVHPPTWERFWPAVAGKQSEQVARELFDGLVCESGRVLFFELAIPWLDRTRAAQVDFSAVAGPVLLIGGGSDRIVPGVLRVAPRPAIATPHTSRYPSPTIWFFMGKLCPLPCDTSTNGSPATTCSAQRVGTSGVTAVPRRRAHAVIPASRRSPGCRRP